MPCHPLHCRRIAARGAFLLALALPLTRGAGAQTAEVVRGRVTDDSARAIPATVMVTRGPDRLTLKAPLDTAGYFRVRFDSGTGDYLVAVSALGYVSARRRVQRQGNERELVANFTLARDLSMLATVKVTAERPVRASKDVSVFSSEPGSAEKWSDGVAGRIAPTVAGDLNAVAATMSNVTVTGAGPSILGSGAESNLNTLNGMGLATGALPRAARTDTRVTGATFDATRGGFAGANIDVQLEPGSRSYQQRRGYLTLDPPQLQASDRVGRALGTNIGGVKASVGADGEMIRQTLTYNVGLDLTRRASDPATLLDADADALLSAGVSPDSVARLVALAAPRAVPLTAAAVPGQRESRGITWLGRLDDIRDTLRTRALTTYASSTEEGALGFGPVAAPSTAGGRRERTLGAQLTLGEYVGPGRNVLTETRLAAGSVRTHVTPYLALPSATVLVRSATTDAGRDVSAVSLGGSSLSTDDERWTLEGANETMWNARGRRHRFKALLWARADGLRQQGTTNALGAYTFNSLEDFAAGRAASFSRTLAQPPRAGSVWNGAVALSHQYAPSRFFGLLYGARLEADGFAGAPESNPALEHALGVTSGTAPMRLHLSPRIGFTYAYNRNRDNGNGMMGSNVGTFVQGMNGVVRGGIGEFRDLLRPGLLADARAATGLPGGTALLSCVGSAVPTPDFARFAADPATVPTECLDGSGALAERAPAVRLIDPSYDVPRSWRASLDWTTNVRKLLFKLGGLASYDLAQPSTIDANFAGTPQLALSAAEGNRPVFVTAAAIDPASGALSAAQSRRSDQYGRVDRRVSDLRGYGGQINLGVSPDLFRFRPGAQLYFSAGYTLQWSRRQYRGFDGAAFADPREVEWAPSGADARHVLVLSGGVSTSRIGTVTMHARAQSGLPFTPLVQGDVNGDGRGGDRAFIPDPDGVADPALASQLRALLADGSASARSCILAYRDQAAARNGCRGPWTQSLDVQWSLPMPSRWGARARPSLYLQNVLAGVDQLVHGSDGLRGWGSPAQPDPVLLVPRGFDAAARQFRYDVNPRFADTRPGRTLLRDPFRMVLDISFDLTTDYDLQQLRRAVEPVRAPDGWRRRAPDSLAAFYLRNTSSIHKMLLRESDSLFLATSQVAALRRADSAYSAQVRALYLPLGEYLARGSGAVGKAELDSVQATQKAYWKIFWEQPEVADSIVTPTQRELMPMLKSMLTVPKKDREHSRYMFGSSVTLVDKAPATDAPVSVPLPRRGP